MPEGEAERGMARSDHPIGESLKKCSTGKEEDGFVCSRGKGCTLDKIPLQKKKINNKRETHTEVKKKKEYLGVYTFNCGIYTPLKVPRKIQTSRHKGKKG